MSRRFAIYCFCLIVGLQTVFSPALAQPVDGNIGTQTELTGTRKQIATIIFAGLAGAILGLSTLSFYGRPQEKLSNIAVGFAVGVIGGVVYTTYQVARSPYDSFQVDNKFYDDELSQRFAVEMSSHARPMVGWTWEF